MPQNAKTTRFLRAVPQLSEAALRLCLAWICDFMVLYKQRIMRI